MFPVTLQFWTFAGAEQVDFSAAGDDSHIREAWNAFHPGEAEDAAAACRREFDLPDDGARLPILDDLADVVAESHVRGGCGLLSVSGLVLRLAKLGDGETACLDPNPFSRTVGAVCRDDSLTTYDQRKCSSPGIRVPFWRART